MGQSKKTIDSLRAKLPEIEKNDTIFYTVNSSYFVDYYFKVNVDSAIYFIQKSIEICKRTKWQESEVSLMTQLAFAYQQKGLVYKAIETNYGALIKAEKLNKIALTYPIKRVLGVSYYELKQYDKAFDLLNAAYKLSLKFNDQYEQLATLNALGNLSIEQKKYKEAESYYKKSLAIALKMNEIHSKGVAFHNLAQALSLQQRSSEALPYFNESLKLHKEENSANSLSNVYVDLADLYFQNKQYLKSLEFVKKATTYSKISGSDELLIKSSFLNYKNQKALGFEKKALTAFEEYNTLKDSTTKEEVNKRIKSLQYEYDLTVKESKILNQNVEILKKDNQNLKLERNRTLLLVIVALILGVVAFLFYNRMRLNRLNVALDHKVKERTSELEEANEGLIRKNEEISQALYKGQTIERKRVALELHDNLSSLLSAVKMSLGAINTQNYSSKEKSIHASLMEMMSSAYAEVRNISHNILPEELERLGLQATIKNLINKLNSSELISFVFTDNIESRIDPKFEFNLYSIILELINNTIKHSGATKAEISLENIDGQLILKAHDNGKGMKKNEMRGNGLSNIQNRVNALNGRLNIDYECKSGTEIIISIPGN